MLQVYSINIYALIDPDAILSFVTPLVAMKFDVLPDVSIEPFRFLPRWVTPLLLKESIGVVPYYCPIELHYLIS